jgi:hypothetical protein
VHVLCTICLDEHQPPAGDGALDAKVSVCVAASHNEIPMEHQGVVHQGVDAQV